MTCGHGRVGRCLADEFRVQTRTGAYIVALRGRARLLDPTPGPAAVPIGALEEPFAPREALAG